MQRIQQQGDTYEAGTAAPSAYKRAIAGLETINPEAEDDHDGILGDAAAAKQAEAEDDSVLQTTGGAAE